MIIIVICLLREVHSQLKHMAEFGETEIGKVTQQNVDKVSGLQRDLFVRKAFLRGSSLRTLVMHLIESVELSLLNERKRV